MRRLHAQGGKGKPWQLGPLLAESRLKVADNSGEAEVGAEQSRRLDGKGSSEPWSRIGGVGIKDLAVDETPTVVDRALMYIVRASPSLLHRRSIKHSTIR